MFWDKMLTWLFSEPLDQYFEVINVLTNTVLTKVITTLFKNSKAADDPDQVLPLIKAWILMAACIVICLIALFDQKEYEWASATATSLFMAGAWFSLWGFLGIEF